MCPFCRASNNDRDLAWTDFSETAGWRSTVWEHEGYMQHLRLHGKSIPALFAAKGVIGLRLENVMIDILHTVDQGLGSSVIGNVLWYLCIVVNCFGATTYALRIKACADDLISWYKQIHGANTVYKGL